MHSQCRVFNVSRSGYYHWLKRSPGPRDQSNVIFDAKIKKIFAEHKGRYGAPRITQELRDQGEQVSQKRVAKRMNVLNLKAKQARKFKVTTDSHHSHPVAPNVLEQNFTARRPNEK